MHTRKLCSAELRLPSYALSQRDLSLHQLESHPQRVTHPSLSPIPNLPEQRLSYEIQISTFTHLIKSSIQQPHERLWKSGWACYGFVFVILSRVESIRGWVNILCVTAWQTNGIELTWSCFSLSSSSCSSSAAVNSCKDKHNI